jgi:hypothetical protein
LCLTLALKSPPGRINVSNVPRDSHSLAWRSGGSRSGSLRCTQRLSRTPEDESGVSSSAFYRHLRYDDGAGSRGPSRGSTCRGRACSVPCTRASAHTRTSFRANSSTSPCDVRERPAGADAGDLLRAVYAVIRGTDADEEADADLQAKDRTGEERCRFQEDPGEAQEALSGKCKTRAWVHKPTLRLF